MSKSTTIQMTEPDKNMPAYYLYRIGQIHENFQAAAAEFTHIMIHGGGVTNMSIGKVIHQLGRIYDQLAANINAARDIDKNVDLESGVRALEYVRSLEPKDDENEEEEEENESN